MDAEEGETRKRLRAHLAFLYDLPIDEEDEREVLHTLAYAACASAFIAY